MADALLHLAYLGPGGPEFLVVMLVLLVMFGAKDAPRILRKINEIIGQIRNTADSFKREVMYSDLENDTPAYKAPEGEDEPGHDDGYDYDIDEEYANVCGDADEVEASDAVFESIEDDLQDSGLKKLSEDEADADGEGDVPKA